MEGKQDGGIFLCPVVLKETEKKLENGDVKRYDDIDKMFEDMGIKLDEV